MSEGIVFKKSGILVTHDPEKKLISITVMNTDSNARYFNEGRPSSNKISLIHINMFEAEGKFYCTAYTFPMDSLVAATNGIGDSMPIENGWTKCHKLFADENITRTGFTPIRGQAYPLIPWLEENPAPGFEQKLSMLARENLISDNEFAREIFCDGTKAIFNKVLAKVPEILKDKYKGIQSDLLPIADRFEPFFDRHRDFADGAVTGRAPAVFSFKR